MPERGMTRHRSRQSGELDHHPTATRTRIEHDRCALAMMQDWCGMVSCWRDRQQLTAERKLLVTMAVGKETVVTDAMEAVRQSVKQEAPDELEGVESHHLRFAVTAIILPAEAHPAI